MKKEKWSDIGQWGGMLALIAGIGLMVWDNTAAGETVIAIGSLIYAITTKIKYYRKGREKNDDSFKVSDQKPANRSAGRGRDKRSELADDNGRRSHVSGMLETGSDSENDRGRAE